VDISAGVAGMAKSFSQTTALPLNQENGSLTAKYEAKGGALVDVGGGVILRRSLAVDVAFSRTSSTAAANVDASVPHPFFFNQPRAIQGSISGVAHAESVVHLDVMWMPQPAAGLEIRIFAGPSFVSVRHDLVSGVTYSETYPFDKATFTGAPTGRRSKSTVGFNAGIDVAKYFTKSVGVGGVIRATAATAKLDSPLSGQLSVSADKLEAAVGVRLRF
jgi:hypothetical protein